MTAIRKAPKGAKPSSLATKPTTTTVIADVAEKLISEIQVLLNSAYISGFKASSEGYNAEYPFKDIGFSPDDDADWCNKRDEAVTEILRGEVV